MKQYLASFTHQHTVPNVFINGARPWDGAIVDL